MKLRNHLKVVHKLDESKRKEILRSARIAYSGKFQNNTLMSDVFVLLVTIFDATLTYFVFQIPPNVNKE